MPVSGTTDASQAKDRQYAQLSRNMEQLATSMEETAELFGLLQDDLRAMSVLSANHAAQYVTSLPVSTYRARL
jgi:hypothetical protein